MKATIRMTRKFLTIAIKAHLSSLRMAIIKADKAADDAVATENAALVALKAAEGQTDSAFAHAKAVRAAAHAEAATFNECI